MNQDQRHQIALRFLGALKDNPLLFKRWLGTAKDDAVAMGNLVAHALDLDVLPTSEDLQAMAAVAQLAIDAGVGGLETADTAPTTVGIMFATQLAEEAPKTVGIIFATQLAESTPKTVGTFFATQLAEATPNTVGLIFTAQEAKRDIKVA